MGKSSHQQDPVVVYQRIQRLLRHWTIEEHLKRSFTLLALGSFLLMCLALFLINRFVSPATGTQPILWIILAWVVFMAALSVAAIRVEAREKRKP